MRGKIFCSLVVVIALISFVACGGKGGNTSSNKSYTFSVDTGDKVKLKLDTSDKYDITSNIPFEISCDGEVMSQGSFIKAEYYEDYVKVAKSDKKAQLIDSGEKNNNKYVFWSYNNEEFNYAILVGDSNTGILLGNIISKESAEKTFERLTISLE